ncbi:putative methyltransferase-domain-containing protein [Hypoxylon rubiginosum]|uniref:Methyltransferase-domain-containing protein n=1 Tax=Hypoxylon rubiginosum TaxID=110542 RepID=A0ACB9YXR7_9PEZI|nr:putative methyltransferase-domain-containing protein [Hypoxylon rubiginosum]
MHYIRLLRPARFSATSHDISLLVTITTDLGDSFLHPDTPVDLVVAADSPTGEPLLQPLLARNSHHPPRRRWVAGMRVLDVRVPLLPHLREEHVTCTVTIRPAAQGPPSGLVGSADVLPRKGAAGNRGLIMPASVEMVGGVCSPVSLRTLELRTGDHPRDHQLRVHLEEDIGESIARHIWDAGVVTACFLADACLAREAISDVLPIRRDSFSVLELGSGVGVLGITVARILERAAAAQGTTLREAAVLLTDLPEAEERARSNIARAAAALSGRDSVVGLHYENLDWDDGRGGRFGPLASARAWDLVVLSDCTYNADSLPALVGTLSALHAVGLAYSEPGADARSSVLLATKPRHASERALFGLLEADGWRYRVLRSVPLPKLGGEDEVVDIYLLEKGAETL